MMQNLPFQERGLSSLLFTLLPSGMLFYSFSYISFILFIVKFKSIFIFAIVNGVVFSIFTSFFSIYYFSLLIIIIYMRAWFLYVILCPTILLHFLIVWNNFSIDSFGFFNKIYYLRIEVEIVSPHPKPCTSPIFIPLIAFSCLIALASTYLMLFIS